MPGVLERLGTLALRVALSSRTFGSLRAHKLEQDFV